jgi:hypothetical protein
MCQGCAYPPEGFQYQGEEEEERGIKPSIQSETKVVLKAPKRDQKSAEKLQLKSSKSMSSVKMLSKGAISEVKIKRSPTVNRINK